MAEKHPPLVNTGDLRDLLAEAIIAVKSGEMESRTANDIAKLAGRLNENFFAEMAARRQLREEGIDVSHIGNLPIRGR